MRFHTTLKDIIVSILVLLCCTTVIWWGIGHLGMTNPSQVLATTIVERLQRGGETTITIKRVGRTYLKTLSFGEIAVEHHGQQILAIDELTIEGGLSRLAFALLGAKVPLFVEVRGLVAHAALDLPFDLQDVDTSFSLQGLFSPLSVQISVHDATAALDFADYSLKVDDADFVVVKKPGLTGLSASGEAHSAFFAGFGVDADLSNLRYGIDETGRIGLEAERMALDGAYGSASALRLVAAWHPEATLSASLSDLRWSAFATTLATSQISARLTIADNTIKEYAFSVADIAATKDGWQVTGPAMTVSIAGDEDGQHHTLSLASRSEESFFVSGERVGAFEAHTLSAHLDWERGKTIDGTVNLSSLSYGQVVTLQALNLSHLSYDVASGDVEAAFSAAADALLPAGYGGIKAPLSIKGGYQKESGTITATAHMDSVQSTQINEPFDLTLSYQSRGRDAQLEAEVEIVGQATLSALVNRREGETSARLNGRFSDLRGHTLAPLLDERAPFLKPYLHTGTALTGNLAFNASETGGVVSGRIASELALIDAKIGTRAIDAGFTILGSLEDDRLTVSSLALATSGYRLSFNGSTTINYWLPKGELSLVRVADGRLLAQATLVDLPPSSYGFSVTTSAEVPVKVDGIVGKLTPNTIGGEATLNLLGEETPFTFDLATDTLALSIEQEGHLTLTASLAPPQELTVKGDRFTLGGVGTTFSGLIEATFKSLDEWSITSPDFELAAIGFRGRRYDLFSPFSARSTDIAIPSFTIKSGEEQLSGSLSYTGFDLVRLKSAGFIAPYEAALVAPGFAKITVSSTTSEANLTARLNDVPLDRFIEVGGDPHLDLSLVGWIGSSGAMAADGSFAWEDNRSRMSASFTFDERSISLFDTSYRNGELTFKTDQALLEDGKLKVAGAFDHVRHLSYIDQDSHITVSLDLSLGSSEGLVNLVRNRHRLLDRRLEANLSIGDVLLYGEGGIADATIALVWEEGRVEGRSELLSFFYDTTNAHFALDAKPQFGIGLSARGSLGATDFAVVISDIYLPLTMLNRTFLKPVFLFKSGYGQGEIRLGGSRDAIRPYGQLFVNATEMFVFWLPDDQIHMKGVSVSIDGNRATTGRVPFFSTNSRTQKTVHGWGDLSAHFDGLTLLNYEIHADSLDDPIFVWIPMSGYEVDIQGYAIGTFNLFGIGFETWLDGDVTISDMNMTLGIRGLPDWYVPAYLTTTRFNVTTAKGVTFFYPNTPTPIIKATLTEHQKFSFTYDHLLDEFEIDGVFAFRSGEIFYFQKNFFITEGSMVLHTDALIGRSAIIPRINLRAKVTDFDEQGNRIDIFLVLRDSNLTTLNPYFESIPAREVNEIMEILGQSILPSGAWGEIGLYSVASLAAAATDVAERLGFLEVSQTTLLTEAIRISLGMDMFSIRSNIVQNILFDALPVTGMMGSLSPIARYLHNTSIFMGKYIGTNFFLQALIHLSAMERSKVATSFLSPDLSIDLELSLDWENPLATVSFFTQPHELSFTNILDTMGFSVTKRIVLR